jgi:hypothetical protein
MERGVGLLLGPLTRRAEGLAVDACSEVAPGEAGEGPVGARVAVSFAVREDLLFPRLACGPLRREMKGGVASDSRKPQHRRDLAGGRTPEPSGSAASVGSGPSNGGAWGSVRLLDLEPDLASGLSDVERASAARLVVRALDVAPAVGRRPRLCATRWAWLWSTAS